MAKGQKEKQPRTQETQSREAKTRCRVHFDFERKTWQRCGGEEVKRRRRTRRNIFGRLAVFVVHETHSLMPEPLPLGRRRFCCFVPDTPRESRKC